MQSWATEELKYAALPDKRLNQRLIKIVENLAQQPQASIPQASGDWASTKATYNFWQSQRITDREGDIYDLFALKREPNSQLLIRAKHNRRINHELKFVNQAIAQTPSSGQYIRLLLGDYSGLLIRLDKTPNFLVTRS